MPPGSTEVVLGHNQVGKSLLIGSLRQGQSPHGWAVIIDQAQTLVIKGWQCLIVSAVEDLDGLVALSTTKYKRSPDWVEEGQLPLPFSRS